MRSFKLPVFLAALGLAGLGTIGCTNRNGDGGTSDGTSAEAYELRSKDNLAPPMDSVITSGGDNTIADTAKGGTHSGE